MTSPQTAPVGLARPITNPNPTPKDRFRDKADNISQHRRLLEAEAFDRALDFALLEYHHSQSRGVRDANGALALGYKMQGIHEFIEILKTISEKPMIPKPQPSPNLRHDLH